MVIKLIGQLIWEAVIVPTIRFVIQYLPMILGSISVMKLSTNYWLTFMIQRNVLLEWLSWYIPTILIISFIFGIIAPKVNKIHPYWMVAALFFSIIMMRSGVAGVGVALYAGVAPTNFDVVTASVFAVLSIYFVALMVQRAWVEILPKRKKWWFIPLLLPWKEVTIMGDVFVVD